MYRRPKFLEVLLLIREQMARDADYDVDRFAEMVRSSNGNNGAAAFSLTDDAVRSGQTSVAGKTAARTRKRRT